MVRWLYWLRDNVTISLNTFFFVAREITGNKHITMCGNMAGHGIVMDARQSKACHIKNTQQLNG